MADETSWTATIEAGADAGHPAFMPGAVVVALYAENRGALTWWRCRSEGGSYRWMRRSWLLPAETSDGGAE